jgi:PAS domain S-box-containing protein
MIPSLPSDAVLDALLRALECAGLGCTVVVDRGDRLERAYANEAIARIWGVDLATARATPVLAPFPARDREFLVEMRSSLSAKDLADKVFEVNVARPDGSTIPVEVALGHVHLDAFRATFVFMRDASAKVTLAAALRESEDHFRRLAEASPDSVTIYSIPEKRYTYANPLARKFLGIGPSDDLSAVDPEARVREERRASFPDVRERLLRGEAVPTQTHRLVLDGGREVVIEASLATTTIDGAPAIISCGRDITERVLLQAELMKQDRLASVGVLAAGVAHELNNPLTTVGMQVRRLRESAEGQRLSDEGRQSLEQIEEASTRMKAIISDLLFMARPVEQPQAHVDVEKILKSTIALFRAGTPSCPRIREELEPLPVIRGYASKLGQVFLNVLRNAVQALDERRVGEIRIRARHADGVLEIAFHDDGAGIPSDVLPEVTKPSFTTKPNGTGLGLWISQTLMAHHGGTLDISSAAGSGTVVTLRLPTDG